MGRVRDQHVGAARLRQRHAALEHFAAQFTQPRADARIALPVLHLVLQLAFAHAHVLRELAPAEAEVDRGDDAERQCEPQA